MSNFVNVYYVESKSKKSKRAMLPPAISSLKNQISKLFKIKEKQIQTIYGPDGEVITSISELTPGMEVFASTQPPDPDFSPDAFENQRNAPNSTKTDQIQPFQLLHSPSSARSIGDNQSPRSGRSSSRSNAENNSPTKKKGSSTLTIIQHGQPEPISSYQMRPYEEISQQNALYPQTAFQEKYERKKQKQFQERQQRELADIANNEDEDEVNNGRQSAIRDPDDYNEQVAGSSNQHSPVRLMDSGPSSLSNTQSSKSPRGKANAGSTNPEPIKSPIKLTPQQQQQLQRRQSVGDYNPQSSQPVQQQLQSPAGRQSAKQSATLQQSPSARESGIPLSTPSPSSRQSSELLQSQSARPNVASPLSAMGRQSAKPNQVLMQSQTARPGASDEAIRVGSPMNNSSTQLVIIRQDSDPSLVADDKKLKGKKKEIEDAEVGEEFISEEDREKRRLLEQGIDHDEISGFVKDVLSFSLIDMGGLSESNASFSGTDGSAGALFGPPGSGRPSKAQAAQILSDQSFKQVIKETSPIIQKLMSQTRNIQEQQATYEYQTFLSRVLRSDVQGTSVPIPTTITEDLHDTMIEFLNRGVFTARGSGINMNYRAAIVGPKQSGKSTFLRLLVKQISQRLVYAGKNKSTFLFFLDFDDIDKNSLETDPIELYKFIIQQTLKNISTQKIEFQPFEDMLLSYFFELPYLPKLTPLPKKYTIREEFRKTLPMLTELTQNLFSALSETLSLQLFLTNVMVIPKFFAQAFGFSRVIYFIDHIDDTDIDCPCTDYLEDDVSNLPLLEFAKLMITDASFIISCHDEQNLLESLELIAENSIDLFNGTDIFSMIDADKSVKDTETHMDDVYFELEVRGIDKIVLLRRDDLAGCPGYLAKWDIIYSDAKQYIVEHHKDPTSKKSRELKLMLLKKIRILSSLIFDSEDESQDFGKNITDFTPICTTEEEE